MEENGTTVNLRDLFIVLFKHKWKILVTLMVSGVTVGVVISILPPVYEASSSMLVKIGRENIYRAEVGDTVPLLSIGHEEMVNSELQVFKSRDLIERVVMTMGPEILYPVMAKNMQNQGKSGESLMQAAVGTFQNSLSVYGVNKSNVIYASFRHESPIIAAKAANLLVDYFKEKHLQVHSIPKSLFIEQQLTSYKKCLKESEDNIEAFRQKYRTFSLPEQKTLLLEQRTNFDTALKNTQSQVAELKQKMDVLRTQLKTIPEEIPLATVTDRYPIVDEVKNTLLNLQLKEQDLLMKYKADNPMLVNVQKEISLAREYLQRQEEDQKKVKTTGRNIVYQDLEKEMIKTRAELSAQESKVSAVSLQLSRLDKELYDLNLRENELRQLLRDREINEINYKIYLEKAEEDKIIEDMNLHKKVSISIIQKAAVPLNPIRPRKNLYIAFSLIFGVIGGLGMALFSEIISQKLTTPEEVEKRLGLRILIALPYDSVSMDRGKEKRLKFPETTEC